MADPSVDDVHNVLDRIFKDSRSCSEQGLLPDELVCFIYAFLPSQPDTTRSKAYLALSAFVQAVRDTHKPAKNSDADPATNFMVRGFVNAVTLRISGTEEKGIIAGISFLIALFQVDWRTATLIFQDDGVIGNLMDAPDIFPSSQEVSVAIANLLAQASGHKSCRAVVPTQCNEWLETKSRQKSNPTVCMAAAVALVKLSKGSASDTMAATGNAPQASSPEESELVDRMKSLVIEHTDQSGLVDAIEGLAYTSVDPRTKEMLSKDEVFLRQLFALVPKKQSTSGSSAADVNLTLLYGIIVIVSNICAYKPRLNAEETQIDRLRRMANSAKTKQESKDDPLEADDRVRERDRRLIKADVSDVLTAIVRIADSPGIRLAVGRALLYLAEDKENRGRLLQSGGGKALMLIIKANLSTLPSSSPKDGSTLDPSHLEPIQALAKLAITASPFQVFGPNEGAVFDAIRPLSILLQHPSAKLLQRFEAMMALTNVSSESPEAASRVARADGLMNKIELLMFEEHELVRRAATELTCNLIAGSEDVFERYSGSESRLQVFVALADVNDLPTRLAASGALATLLTSPAACTSLLKLQNERHRVLPILAQLIDPTVVPQITEITEEEDEKEGDDSNKREAQMHPGLVHRGVVCVQSFFAGIKEESAKRRLAQDAKEVGLDRALVNVIKGREQYGINLPVVQATLEALKLLK